MYSKRAAIFLTAIGAVGLTLASCSSDDSNPSIGVGGSSGKDASADSAPGEAGLDAASGSGGATDGMGGASGKGGSAGTGGGGGQGGSSGNAGTGGMAGAGGVGGQGGGGSAGAAGAGGQAGFAGSAGAGGAAGTSGSGGAGGTGGGSGSGGGAGAGGAAGTSGSSGAGGTGGGSGGNAGTSGAAGSGGSSAPSRHDDAADPAYASPWSESLNGGVGFGGWILSRSIQDTWHNGWFLDTSAKNGPADSPTNIDTGGKSFGLYANGSDGVSNALAVAWRPLSGKTLEVGETVTVRLDTGYVEPPEGMVGISLPGETPDSAHVFSALPSSSTRFAFVFRGGKSNYETYDQGGYHDSGAALEYGGLKVAFTLTAAETYELRINDGAALSGTLGGVSGTFPTGIAFFNYTAGSGSSHDLFFNSIEVSHP